MNAAPGAVTSASFHAICLWALARSPRLRPISSHPVLSTRITASTSATGASFTTPALHTDCCADRWKTYLSNASLMATTSEFEAIRDASVVARWWSGRVRDLANAAIAS